MIRRSIFSVSTDRPVLCRYFTAYLLIGVGATVVDIGAGADRNVLVAVAGMIAVVAGLGVFVASIVYSLRYVVGVKRPLPNHCPTCGYNLTGNVSGICPECGSSVPT